MNVTSSLAWLAREVPGDLLADIHSTRDYVGIRAHARAKLLTAAWTLALSRQQAGTGVVAATVNPGMAWTAMTQALTPQVVPSWRYPAIVADPATQDQAVSSAWDLARDAPTAVGRPGRK